MKINGRALHDDGIVITGLTGWLDGPEVSRAVVALPHVAGVVPSPVATTGPRTMQLTLRVPVATLTDRAAALAPLAERLAGVLTIRTDDWPDRIVRAVAGPLRVSSIVDGAVYAVPALTVTVTLTCYDAASYDAEPRTLVIGATPVPVPLGSLPSTGVLIWQGAWAEAATRTLTYRDGTGTARTTMAWTPPTGSGGLAAGDVLELDLARAYATKVAAPGGTRTNAYGWRSGGTDWIVLDPAHGAPSAGRWPTLEVSAGSALLLYRRAYAL